MPVSKRPNGSSPIADTKPVDAPWRAAAMQKFDVSPPKPCRNSGRPGCDWLNSIIASPSARISGNAAVIAYTSPHRSWPSAPVIFTDTKSPTL